VVRSLRLQLPTHGLKPNSLFRRSLGSSRIPTLIQAAQSQPKKIALPGRRVTEIPGAYAAVTPATIVYTGHRTTDYGQDERTDHKSRDFNRLRDSALRQAGEERTPGLHYAVATLLGMSSPVDRCGGKFDRVLLSAQD